MGVYKLSAAGGVGTARTNYNSFLAGNPKYVAPSYESIATVTVGSGGSSTITFSSIPSTYTHLQLRILGKNNAADNGAWNIFLNFNSSASTSNAFHYLLGDGASASAGASTGNTHCIAGVFAGSTTTTFSNSIIDILDYKNTNKYKTIRSLNGVDFNGSGSMRFYSSLWQSTQAISSIDITSEGSKTITQYSSFALYGIK